MSSELGDMLPALQRAAAGRQRGRTVIRDDLAQEGMIAAWEALQGGETVALATWRAVQRMDRMLTPERQHKWTGLTTRRRADSLKHEALTLSLDALSYDASTTDPEADLDVRRVVAALPLREKEILYRRFWLKETWAEIGAALGMSLQGAYNIFDRSIRPRLRNELAEHSHQTPVIDDALSVVCSLALAAGVRESPEVSCPPAPPGGQRAPAAQGAA